MDQNKLLWIAIISVVIGFLIVLVFARGTKNKNEQLPPKKTENEKLKDISGLAGFLAWLNLIGGTFGFIYYTFINVLQLGDLKTGASRLVLEQIQATQVSSVFLGITILIGGLTVFVIIQLLRGIYRNSRVK